MRLNQRSDNMRIDKLKDDQKDKVWNHIKGLEDQKIEKDQRIE
jgi:hypothetical protein